jgi:hypothetical protein
MKCAPSPARIVTSAVAETICGTLFTTGVTVGMKLRPARELEHDASLTDVIMTVPATGPTNVREAETVGMPLCVTPSDHCSVNGGTPVSATGTVTGAPPQTAGVL